jgi:hypothetical protein
MTNLKPKIFTETLEPQSDDFYQLESLVEIILEDLRKRNARIRRKKGFPFKK